MAKSLRAHDQRQKRKLVKEKIAAIVEKHVGDAFNEAAYMASEEGAPRSTLDFLRWFNVALMARVAAYHKLPPRRTARKVRHG